MARSPSETFAMFGVTFKGEQIIRSPAADDARRHVIRSWALACVVPLPLLIILSWYGVGLLNTVALAIATAYIMWGSYWGIVGIARILVDAAGQSSTETGVFAAFCACDCRILVVPIALGILYGILGGGVNEFLKCREIIKDPGGASS